VSQEVFPVVQPGPQTRVRAVIKIINISFFTEILKKLQTQTVYLEELRKTLLYKKDDCKMQIVGKIDTWMMD